MPDIDRITEEDKKTIIDILKKAMQVEYDMIVNHLRIIDQIIDKGSAESLKFLDTLKRLGTDSLRHTTRVASLIERMGGEPDFEAIVVDEMPDIKNMLVKQLEKEKLAMSAYKDAKLIAQKSQAKAKGFFGRLLSRGEEIQGDVNLKKSKVIFVLEGLQDEEWGHMKRVELALIQMNIQPEK